MKEKYGLSCPEMKWACGDMLNLLHFEQETFSSVLDKGTLDALMSEKNINSSRHGQYFNVRLLKRVLAIKI